MDKIDSVIYKRFPVFSEQSDSLLKKYLTPELFDQLKSKKTKNGFTFSRLIHSGVLNQDSGIGVYAGDADSYKIFADVLTPIIEDYHRHEITGYQLKDFLPIDSTIESPDPENKYIISTRIRVGRNLQGFPLGPLISGSERKIIEKKTAGVLLNLEGELAGRYHSLETMEKEEQENLINSHLLFKEGDRFLEAAGLNRDWPEGRGIFYNKAKSFLVWVNEEDQLRIISMEKGGDIINVFNRLSKAVSLIEKDLDFLYDPNIGYITSCPTNLGTAMRASVHIRLSGLSGNMALLKETAENLNLQIRGIHGEHSESEGGIFDISNKRRLGLSEKECIMNLYKGVREIILIEEGLK